MHQQLTTPATKSDARHVDPLLDPGVPAHFNAYVYSYNNPTTFSDPSGARPAPEERRAKTSTTAQTAPPPTSQAALNACADFWCGAQWWAGTAAQFGLGALEGVGQLAYEAVKPFCGACLLVETGIEVYEMVSDWDGYVARKTDEFETAVGLITGNSETWQEAVIDPVVYSWENNPGNLAGHVAVDIATLAVPGGIALKGPRVLQAAESGAARMAAVRAAGAEGEALAGIVKNKKRIPSATGTANYRIPDELNDTTIGEVKNVAVLHYTNQLQDFAAYAASNPGMKFVIYVRKETIIMPKLQKAVDDGLVTIDKTRLP